MWGQIKNWHGICLQVSIKDGVPDGSVQMWTCDSSNPTQQWSFSGSGGVGHIQSYWGLCLTIGHLHKDGSKLHMGSCVAGTLEQLWVYDSAIGLIRSAEAANGKSWCLDAAERALRGGHLQMWSCWDQNPTQQWALGDAPWASQEPVLGSVQTASLPTACPNRFVVPPAPWKATLHNGAALQDTCFNWTGPRRTNHVFLIGRAPASRKDDVTVDPSVLTDVEVAGPSLIRTTVR